MSKVLQHLVSKNKRRIIINGFDLDLTYITDQIIAMGLPATGVSGIYRNPQGEVIRFLESFHGGAFRIYNLCKRPQDQYDPEKFGGSVVRGARLPPPPFCSACLRALGAPAIASEKQLTGARAPLRNVFLSRITGSRRCGWWTRWLPQCKPGSAFPRTVLSASTAWLGRGEPG